MNSDALLRCFKSGASLSDLAAVIDVDTVILEQMVREAMAGPCRGDAGASSRPVVAHAPAGAPGRQAGRQAGERRRRRSFDEIREAALTALANEPAKLHELMRTTGTTSNAVMTKVLESLLSSKLIRREGRSYHYVGK